MLYPVLHRMEGKGWIKSRWVESESARRRKYYSLKQDGRKAQKEHRDQWLKVHAVLTSLWEGKYV
jgi:DNA-binding PadR family transcriptional regulator